MTPIAFIAHMYAALIATALLKLSAWGRRSAIFLAQEAQKSFLDLENPNGLAQGGKLMHKAIAQSQRADYMTEYALRIHPPHK